MTPPETTPLEQPAGYKDEYFRIRSAIVATTMAYIRLQRAVTVDPTVFNDDSLLFSSLDLDSLDVMMLAEQISSALEIDIELTALIDFPTIGSLARHTSRLMSGLGIAEDATGVGGAVVPNSTGGAFPPTETVQTHLRQGKRAVFVVGANHVLPGGGSPFGVDCVSTVLLQRWDVDKVGGVRFGSFIEGIDTFDESSWGLPAGECELMDPQQRLLLELCAEMVLDASRIGTPLSQRKSQLPCNSAHCGVFVGASSSEYLSLVALQGLAGQRLSPHAVTAGGIGVIPGRIAYHLGIQGPALATDTACSSSLVSLGVAVGMMELGMLSTSLTCGSNIMLDKRGFELFEAANMLALDGRCKAMDAAGDGFSRGEAITSLLLDTETPKNGMLGVLGVICGVSINQDGRSSRLTAPNGPAQSALIADALRVGNASPAEVASLFLHGTGTPLGDPIEVGAAFRVYFATSAAPKVLGLSAVKTALGHSEAAAGTVSLAAAIEMGASQFMLPTLHLRQMNENIVRIWERDAIGVRRMPGGEQGASRCDNQPAQRMVGVSSFASQGTNCHVLISQAIDDDVPIHPTNDRWSHRPLALPWVRRRFWILPQAPRLLVLSVTSTCMSFAIRRHSAVGDWIGNPDGFLNSLIDAARCCLALLLPEGMEACLIGVERLNTAREIETETEDLRVRVDGGAMEVSAAGSLPSSSSPVGRAAVALVPQTSNCEYVTESDAGSYRVLRGEYGGRLESPSAAIATMAGVPSACRIGFTAALTRFPTSLSSRRIRSVAAIYIPSMGGYPNREDAGFGVSCAPGWYRTPAVELTGVLYEADGGLEQRKNKISDISMEYNHIAVADTPVARHQAEAQPPGVTVNSCGIGYRPCQTTSMVTSVITALSMLQQVVGSPEGMQKSASTRNPRMRPHRVLMTSVDTSLNISTCRSTPPAAFPRSVHCIAHSLSREMPDKIEYPGDVTAVGKIRTTKLLERQMTADADHLRSLPTASEPIIIRGGTGGLGKALCGLFQAHGVPLIVSGRTGLVSGAGPWAAMTTDANLPVTFVIRRALSGVQEDLNQSQEHVRLNVRDHRLIHASGVLRDAGVRNQTLSMARDMFAAKPAAAELEFGACFLLGSPLLAAYAFSSVAALLHPAGSSTYGAINAVMESITAAAMTKGVEALSIQWGAWASIGMVSSSERVIHAMQSLGVSMIRPLQGIAAFSSIVARRPTTGPLVACVPFMEIPTMEPQKYPLYETEMTPTTAWPTATTSASISAVRVAVRRVLEGVLRLPVDSMTESLLHYGADSLCAIDIQQALSKEFKVALPSTALYDYPTAEALALAIHAEAAVCETGSSVSMVEGFRIAENYECIDTIGIHSIAIRSPAAAHLTVDCTTVAAYERWDVESHMAEAPRARFGKFLLDGDLFDAELFKISPHEAANMDPQQRILLEDSFAMASSTMGESREVGVIVGLSFWDYSIISENMNGDVASASPAMKLTGRNLSVASGRISYIHGYRGPSMTIDTACSSSLVAIHVASLALRNDTPAPSEVLVGCAMMSLAPDVMRSLSMASMVSDEGRSRTLDREANGYGRGEGTAILVMSRVLHDDDGAKKPLLGIVASSAINQDGRSASLTAPNGPSQLDLLRVAVIKANISPLDIHVRELHGTGTPLGDPIEMTAVAKAQRQEQVAPETSPVVLSATKTVFGHTEPVAGCIGVHSVLKQLFDAMRHPLLHLRSLSSLVEAVLGGGAAARTMVPSRSIAPLLTRKYASISAFAFQGTNAHVVVESSGSPGAGFKRPLSAKSTYRGQRHWFIGGIHCWMQPAINTWSRGGRRASGDAVTWLAKPRGLAMHEMLQHRVFGKLILPGMAIFRIMSDSGALSVAPSPAWTSPALVLCEPTIYAPVMLSAQGCEDLAVRVSPASGKVVVSNHALSIKSETASGAMAAVSIMPKYSTRAGAKRFESHSARGIRSTWYSGNHFDPIHIASMELHPERRHDETVTEPSIEMLDAATHLAAYRETCDGMQVSIPVSSDAIDIRWKRTIGLRHRAPAVSVSCNGESAAQASPSWQTRSYNIRAPGYGERRLRSLNSKTVGNSIKKRHVDRVIRQKQADFPDAHLMYNWATRHIATGIIRVHPTLQSDARGSTLVHGSLRPGLAFYECVRSLDARTKSFCGPIGNHPLLDGQLRVASNELGFSLPSRPSVIVPLLPSRESFDLPGKCPSGATFAARVIVGGTSGIGQALAGWLAARNHGADPLILIGRRGVLQPSSSRYSALHDSCTLSSLDCSSRARAAHLAAMCEGMATHSCGVMHTAGVVMDEGFLHSSSKSWRNVFSPKYDAFKSVSAALGRLPVQDILSTSSASIDIGNGGQANYVTANLAMEGEAKALLKAGIPSRIIRYGPWKGLGMLSGQRWHQTAARLGRMGLSLMTPLEGIIATAAFLRTPHDQFPHSTIGIIDWDTVSAVGAMSDGTAATATKGSLGPQSDHRHPGGGRASKGSSTVDLESIIRIISEVAGDDANFFGLDSLSSMEVRNRLGMALGISLPPTLLFDYPTVDKLVDHLVQRLTVGQAMGATVAEVTPTSRHKTERQAVHVSRLAQMVPGTSLTTFESVVDVFRAERNLQRTVPLDRWDNDSRFSMSGGAQSIYTSFATFVDFLWAFDAELFSMKPHDVQYTDPQARCLLSTTLAALTDADGGCGVQSQGEGGVFVGSMFYDYLRLFEVPNQGLDPSAVLGNGSPYLSGRLAYAFDLAGPCVGIDTACSSSLVAVHGGRSEINNGTITYAVACGSNAIIIPHTSALICQLGALSGTGRCLSLDATADGYGRGEAFVTCVLSLVTDQDTLAVLNGTAVNQDGRSISLTAPNGPSQERLIKSCLSVSGLLPKEVHSVSIHGTGTLLGDPIETQALSNVFIAQDGPRRGPPVTITANKSLFGHCEGAAGTTGLLNALFSVSKHESNAIHPLRGTNPYLVLAGLVPRLTEGPILAGSPYFPHSSGTSSFGMSGTNAHGIVTRHESSNVVEDGSSCPGRRPTNLGRPVASQQLYRQPGLAGRCAFVPVSKHKWLQFHAKYTQSQASALFDHRVRLGVDGFRPLLAATAQIDLAASVARELVSDNNREILHEISFMRPSLFIGGGHETLVDVDVVHGTISLRDGHVTGQAAAHTSGAVARVASDPMRRFFEISGSGDEDARCGLGVGPAPSDIGNQNTASVRATILGAPSSMMDAALHLSVVGDKQGVQKVPVSCEAIFVDEATLFGAETWATNHRLEGVGAGIASQATIWRPFCVAGLKSRPIGDLNSRNMSNIWTGSVVNPTERGDSEPAMPGPGALTRTDVATCLRSIQLLQEDRAGELHSIDLPLAVAQALRRVHANEAKTGSRTSDGLFLAPTGAPTRMPEYFGAPSNVMLTSLGGIGSLVALYFAGSASAVHACCRTPATQGRFQSHLVAQQAPGAKPPTAPVTIANFDMCHREDACLLLEATVGITIHHTAGTLRDALIDNVTSVDVTETVAPKTGVLRNITSYLRYSAMDSMFAYSSISSIFGTRGQATYAMANAAMDARVQAAWSRGMPCFALQWGLWEQRGAGMAASLDPTATKRLEASGFLRLSPVEGLAYLERYLVWGCREAPAAIVSKMLDKAEEFSDQPKSAPWSARNMVDRSVAQRWPTKSADINEALRRVFYQTASQAVDESVPVLQQGLDSISSIEFTQSLEQVVGVKLPLTFVYDYPMPEDMVAFIQAESGSSGSASATGLAIREVTPMTPAEPTRKTVAVVTYATKYPASSSHAARQAPFQVDGAGVLRRTPFHSLNAFASAFEYHELHAFDAGLFRLGRGVALALDPNIRWLLELQLELLGAGRWKHQQQPPQPRPEDVGVFLGWMWGNEHKPLMDVSPNMVTGASAPFAVGYVAYQMQMCGPCIPVDTACSSSLVALHLAKAAVENGECTAATVNGVNAFLGLDTWHKIKSISAESRDGRCKTLDASADGYGRGEGFVSMLIQDAVDLDDALAFISGSACSTAGRRSALTAPNGPSQMAVVQDALERARRPSLDSVALHGTGTALGDPIEIRSLLKSLPMSASFRLGSPKSAVGHTEGSAGLTNALSAIVSASQRRIDALHNLRELNPLLHGDISGYVPRQAGPALSGAPAATQHVTGCSSFGMSGVNSHAILHCATGDVTLHPTHPSHVYIRNVLVMPSPDHNVLIPAAVKAGNRPNQPRSLVIWQFIPSMDEARIAWMSDHLIKGSPILPGTFFLGISAMSKAYDSTAAILCHSLWTSAMYVRDIMGLSLLVSSEGTITCKSAWGTSVFTTTVARVMGGISSQSSRSLTTRPWFGSPAHARRDSQDMIRTWTLHAASSARSSTIFPIIAAIAPTGTLTGDWRLPPVPRADAALHLTATATVTSGNLYVPSTLEVYLWDQTDRRDLNTDLRDFASSLWPTIDDNRCAVGASANGDMKLLGLGAALYSAHECTKPNISGVVAETTGLIGSDEAAASVSLSYAVEAIADVPILPGPMLCPESRCRYTQNGLKPLRGRSLAPSGLGVSVDASSFPAHVAALQSGPLLGRVDLLGPYNDATRLLLDIHRKETGEQTFVAPPDAGGACGASFRLAMYPTPELDGDRFPRGLTSDELIGGSDTVQVKVESVALNFRDFLVAMGLYPTAVDPASTGSDFSGTIVGVGRIREQGYCVGDAVFGQSKGVFKDCICLEPDVLASTPVGAISCEDASTLPTVFLTALSCMKCVDINNISDAHCGGKRSILIHATSGGLGLALAQVARASGLAVYATAGSPYKRTYVRTRGVDTACNSRDLTFVDDIARLDGVGAVVNTLTSTGYISAGQSILSAGGQLVEVSKRDIFSHARIIQDRPDIRYHIVAVDMMPSEALAGDMAEIAAMLTRGDITPIPSARYSLSQLSQAMNRFKSSRAIGKTVCSRAANRLIGHDRRKKWLVTGGAGALGGLSCSMLVRNGKLDLILPLRRMPNASSVQNSELKMSTLCASATMVHLVLADVADRSDFASLETMRFQGMIHSSGALRDGLILGIRTLRPSNEVLAAKSVPMLGHLRGSSGTFLSGAELVVSFSSISSVIPNPGQGNYSWANCLLDGAAEADLHRGRRHVVVNWGPWAGSGMASHLDESSLNGIRMISPAAGAHIIEAILRSTSLLGRLVCVALSGPRRAQLLKEPGKDETDLPDATAKQASTRTPRSAPRAWDRASVASVVEDLVAGLLDEANRKVLTGGTPLMQAGLDSLGSIELVAELKKTFNTPFSSTLLFDFPTIDSMVEHVVSVVSAVSVISDGAVGPTKRDTSDFVQELHPKPQRVMSPTFNRRYVRVLDWTAALPTVRAVPFDRWDCDRSSRMAPPRFGGFVPTDCIEEFDHGAFFMSTKESAIMDPQHRVLMMQVMAVRGEHVPQTSVAVGIGRLEDPWHVMIATDSLIHERNGLVSTSRAASVSAGRLSYHFDFRGGCLAIDTACSSSLVALHIQFESLTSHSDSVHHGFVCGVNMPMSIRTSAMLGASAMLAMDGRCKALDAAADGYGRSEGSSVLKLCNQTLENDSSPIIVLGTSINQDGRSAALTAPNGPAQEAVLRAAGAATGLPVLLAGMHGTGTPLGDPIEVSSLMRALKDATPKENALDTVTLFPSKSVMGHAETASGILGLVTNIQMSVNLSYNGLPTLRQLNRHVVDSVGRARGDTAIVVPRQQSPCTLRDIHGRGDLASCVSAFAFQGSNASVKLSCRQQLQTPRSRDSTQVAIPDRVMRLPVGHPLITHVRFHERLAFQCRFMHPLLHLQDHRISENAVFPASGYVELIAAAAEALRIQTGVDGMSGKSPLLANAAYSRPYLMNADAFFLEVAVDAGSGLSTVREAGHELCTATTTMIAGSTCAGQTRFRRTDVWPRSVLIMAHDPANQTDTPAVVAQTCVQDGHIVHGLDSTWHLCAFFVALEENTRFSPVLRIPRTLSAFCRREDLARRSCTGAPEGRRIIDVSLSRPAHGLFTVSSTHFDAIHLTLNTVSKAPGIAAGGWRDASTAAPLYAMHPRSGVDPDLSGHPSSKARSTSWLHMSDTAEIGCLLGTLQQGVIPGCSGENEVLRAGLDAVDRIRESGHAVDQTTLMNRTTFDAVVEHRGPGILIDSQTTVLVPGGTGAVGTLVRRFVATLAPGAHVVSLSRSFRSFTDERKHATKNVDHTSFVCGDAALDGLNLPPGPTSNRPAKLVVINAAGVLIDQQLGMIDMRSARSVIAPKCAGTAALVRAVNALPTVALLHCGSIATVLGNEGQASYIMANTVLTSLSSSASERGFVSFVVHFGPFGALGTGMASSAVQRMLRRHHVPLLPPADGLRAVHHALRERFCDEHCAVYCAFDFPKYFESMPAEMPTTSVHSEPSDTTDGRRDESDHFGRFERQGRTTVARISKIVQGLVEHLDVGNATADGSHQRPMAAHTKFADIGLDSLAAAEFAEALRQEFHIPFTATVLFDHPTLVDLAEHIDNVTGLSSHQSQLSEISFSYGAIRPLDDSRIRSIAIIATTYRFPGGPGDGGGYANPTSRWAAGKEIQSLVPSARWDVDAHYAPNQTQELMYVRIGGWLDHVDIFDPTPFGLSRDEATAMDPQLRLLLELTHELVRGVPNISDASNTTSNFVGCMYQEYLDGVLRVGGMADTVPSAITSTGMSFLVGRLSYHYNFRGLAVSCDTACSSSLVGVHLARKALLSSKHSGEQALAHGVNMMLSARTTSRICMLQALSPVGRCKTADISADGYGRSESGMSMLLGATVGSDADDGSMLAVLLGSGAGHNGTTGGISAPHGPSQARLITDVWRESGARGKVTSLHGTGTSLGDPIEFQALQSIWNRRSQAPADDQEDHPIRKLLAIKAWAGHMEGTAGLVGLVLPLLESTVVAPVCHLRHLNQHIARQGLHGIFLSRQMAPHAASKIASSSFGMGGTNAHAVARVAAPITGREGTSPVFARHHSWPLVPTGTLPTRLNSLPITGVLFEMETRNAFWMSDHVVNGRALVAGATILSVLADTMDILSTIYMAQGNIKDRKCAVTMAAFLMAADVGPVIGVSLRQSPSEGSQAVLSVSGSRMCTASCDRIDRQEARTPRGKPSTSLSSQHGQGAPTSMAFIDPQVHPHAASLSPCVMDGSMHLGLVNSVEARVPVSVGAFVRGVDAPGHVPIVSCLVGINEGRDGNNVYDRDDQMHAISQFPHATLSGVRSTRPRLPARKVLEAVLRARVEELTPTGPTKSTAMGRPYIPVRSMVVDSTILTTSRPEDWHNPLSIASQTIREHGDSTFAVDPTLPMGAAILAVASKEYSSVRAIGHMIEGSPDRSAPDSPHGKEFAELPTATAPSLATGIRKTDRFNIVTGAFGGIGTVVARWLELQESPTILLGRRVRAPALSTASVAVFVQCDISSTTDFSHVLRDDRLGTHYVLHHVAGTVRDAMVHHVTPSDVRTTVAGKSGEAFRSTLAQLSITLGAIRASFLYSSITGVTGNRGQLAYAYANGLLNRLAISQTRCGLSTQSIAWGAWAGKGMARGMERVLASSGVQAMRPAAGLQILELLSTVRGSPPKSAYAPVIVAGKFDDVDALLGKETRMGEAAAETGGAIRRPTSPQQPPSTNMDAETIRSTVQGIFEDAAGGGVIGEDDSILLQLDSLAAVELVDKLSKGLGVALAPTLLYDYPSFRLLVDQLVDTLGVEGTEVLAAEEESTSPPRVSLMGAQSLSVVPRKPLRTYTLKAGYYCSPGIDELNQMEDDQIRNVSNFVIGREGYGEIRFLLDVDLAEVNLNTEVSIGKRGMMVSPGAHPGERLNQPALMCFQAPNMKTAAARRRLRTVLSNTLRSGEPKFVFLDEETGYIVLFVEDWW